MKDFGMQTDTELQFSSENSGIYSKLLLSKLWDYEVLLEISFFWSEKLHGKALHWKLRDLKPNVINPCYFEFKAMHYLRGKRNLPPWLSAHAFSRHVFDITLTATCHSDKMQPPLINRGLALSTHMSFSDLCFPRKLHLIFVLSGESWRTW